jgi:predicted nucleic acid-binding protein
MRLSRISRHSVAQNQHTMTTSRNLVLDANIVISAALGHRVRDLITTADDEVSFFAPQIAFDDAERHLPTITARRGWSADALADAQKMLEAVRHLVDSVPEEMYQIKKTEALARISARDSDDWHFVALALILECPVWTHDTDYLGSGIPTWATNTVQIYLHGE